MPSRAAARKQSPGAPQLGRQDLSRPGQTLLQINRREVRMGLQELLIGVGKKQRHESGSIDCPKAAEVSQGRETVHAQRPIRQLSALGDRFKISLHVEGAMQHGAALDFTHGGPHLLAGAVGLLPLDGDKAEAQHGRDR